MRSRSAAVIEAIHAREEAVAENDENEVLAEALATVQAEAVAAAGEQPITLEPDSRKDAKALTSVRKEQHGDWMAQSLTANNLKTAAHEAPGWSTMSASQQEAVDMILTKVSRIVTGNPYHQDHWDDIGGYALLGAEGHK
jgi:hypothetical protein